MTTIYRDDEQLLTTKELADLTKISKYSFERWRHLKNGGPEVTHLGPQIVRYKWAHIKAWRESLNATVAA
jgi:predicted DNA-binding transcriptional regulator AlpA